MVGAGTLAAAVALLAGGESIDCVLLDLSLPDAEGLDAVQAVQGADPAVPVVVLTGTDDQELAVRALQAGAQDYLPEAGDGFVVVGAGGAVCG